MAIVDSSSSMADIHGKLGSTVISKLPNGTVTVRSLGRRKAPPTPGERRSRQRMAQGRQYVRGVLGDPAVKAVYEAEAKRRNMRTCDLAMSDFLTDPIVTGMDAGRFTGLAGGCLLVLTGDDFKVRSVRVTVRKDTGERLQEGFAQPAQGSVARVWVYTASTGLAFGQVLKLEITATDRAGHATVFTAAHSI